MKKSLIVTFVIAVVVVVAFLYVKKNQELPGQAALAGQATNELVAQKTVVAASTDTKTPDRRSRSRCITYPGVPGGTAWVNEEFTGGVNIFGWHIGGSWTTVGVPYNIMANSHCPAVVIIENLKVNTSGLKTDLPSSTTPIKTIKTR